MPLYNYSNTAAPTTISSGINSSVTTITITTASGLPAVPFKMVLEPSLANQEIVLVTARTGTSLTVTRGVDGSTGVSHSSGAVIAHEVTAEDIQGPANGTSFVFAQLAADATISAQTTATLALGANEDGWTLASSNTRLTPPATAIGRWWKMTISARTTAPPAWRYLDGRVTSTTGTTIRMAAATAPAVGSSAAEYDLMAVSQPFQIISTTGYFTITMNAVSSTTFFSEHFAATGTSAVTQGAATWILLECIK